VPQGHQVPGDLGLGHPEDRLDLADAEFPVREQGQDAQPGLVGQGAEEGHGLFQGSLLFFTSYTLLYSVIQIYKNPARNARGKMGEDVTKS
jgi:hypothetical protein